MRTATKSRVGKDREYLAFLHQMPCCVCFLIWYRRMSLPENWGRWLTEYVRYYGDSDMARIIGQTTPTQAAHIGERGLSMKCPDLEAIPLSARYHFDAKDSQHASASTFFERFGIDRYALVSALNEAYKKNGLDAAVE